MRTRLQPKFTNGRAPRKQSQRIVLTLALAAFTIIAMLAVVFGVRAVAFGDGSPAVRRVPDDFPTIQAAINAAGAGDIIQVREGTYHENLTLDKPVSLVAETFDQINPTMNKTIIDSGSASPAITIPPGLTQMPTIRGFVIQNSGDGIQANSEFIAEYNYFVLSHRMVAYQSGGGGINRGNIYFKPGADAITLDDMNRPLLIEANRIMYTGMSGIDAHLQNSTAPPAVTEITIRNNEFIGSGEDGIQIVDDTLHPQDTNRRFVISGNLIANSRQAGIGLVPDSSTTEDFSGAAVLESVRVYNNTFYGNNFGISGGGNLVAFNNLITNSLSRAVWRVQGELGTNSVVAYTLFFGNQMDSDQSNLGTGILSGVDPHFEAAPNPGPDGAWGSVDDDFSGLLLRSDSPAIDRGTTQYIANEGEAIPPTPITGFVGATVDLGWREFGSAALIIPVETPTASPTLPPTLTLESPTPQSSDTSTPESPTPASPTPVVPSTTPTTGSTSTPAVTSTLTAPPTSTSTSSTPQVTIATLDPNAVQVNTTVTVTITGSGFQNGLSVTFENGQGQAPEVVATQVVDSNTITIVINSGNSGEAAAQAWDVRVTNPDQSTALLSAAFTVTPAS